MSKAMEISLFYESACPFCQQWISSQLLPMWKAIGDKADEAEIRVSLVPFGNAKEEIMPDGHTYFTCQHGPRECYFNKVQACGIDVLTSQKSWLPWIGCVNERMMKFECPEAWITCPLPREEEMLLIDILLCTMEKWGNDLIHEAAMKTPQHDYVPWVTIDGEHKPEAERSIHDAVCKKLPFDKIPKEIASWCKEEGGVFDIVRCHGTNEKKKMENDTTDEANHIKVERIIFGRHVLADQENSDEKMQRLKEKQNELKQKAHTMELSRYHLKVLEYFDGFSKKNRSNDVDMSLQNCEKVATPEKKACEDINKGDMENQTEKNANENTEQGRKKENIFSRTIQQKEIETNDSKQEHQNEGEGHNREKPETFLRPNDSDVTYQKMDKIGKHENSFIVDSFFSAFLSEM